MRAAGRSKENRVVKVTGDPKHPFTRGTLCPKMVHYERTVHSPARLTQPLIKGTGPKGSGQFRPIGWEEAVAHIAGRWKEIIKTHGAQAILPFSYAGTMGVVQRNAGHPFSPAGELPVWTGPYVHRPRIAAGRL